MTFCFNGLKAAQAAAILLKENGGEMDTYLFIKMLYLADRAAMAKWTEPITGDGFTSMRYGPVLSKIYNLTRGASTDEHWNIFIADSDPDANRIQLRADPGEDELSPAETEILKDIWNRFHRYTFGQMKNYSHSLSEYDASVQASNTSKPIPPSQMLRALSLSEERIQEATRENEELRRMNQLLGCY